MKVRPLFYNLEITEKAKPPEWVYIVTSGMEEELPFRVRVVKNVPIEMVWLRV